MLLPKLLSALSGLALTATLLLSGCGNPQVDAAVNELAETFGGRVAAKAGYATSTKDDELSGKFVEVELSGRSAEIGKAYDGNWALPASYAAFIVYQTSGRSTTSYACRSRTLTRTIRTPSKPATWQPCRAS